MLNPHRDADLVKLLLLHLGDRLDAATRWEEALRVYDELLGLDPPLLQVIRPTCSWSR